TKLAKINIDKKQYLLAVEHLQQALAMRRLTDIGAVNEVNILIKIATLQAKVDQTVAASQNIYEALSILSGVPLTDPKAITLETFEKQHSSFFISALKDAAGFYLALFE